MNVPQKSDVIDFFLDSVTYGWGAIVVRIQPPQPLFSNCQWSIRMHEIAISRAPCVKKKKLICKNFS